MTIIELFIAFSIPLLFIPLCLLFIMWVFQRLEETQQRRQDAYEDNRLAKRVSIESQTPRHLEAARIINPMPALPEPEHLEHHDECGGKFCELRGCAILGSCQR